MRAVNLFLRESGNTIARNPCVSPDFCLDWPAMRRRLEAPWEGVLVRHHKSSVAAGGGELTLIEDPSSGDCAWAFTRGAAPLEDGFSSGDISYFPASWSNLLRVKNLVQEHDPGSTVFPTAGGNLGRGTLGIGARFTTLHWPAVEWAMSALEIGLTANQNSIPRELVYDVDAMVEGRLDRVPFPFIGTSVPEGHQGQSVEGMSHGCVLSKLKTGFHRRRIPWSFNADHQPIGGAFDAREDALVRGSLLASYITFDLSPELSKNRPEGKGEIDASLAGRVLARVKAAGIPATPASLEAILCTVMPSMLKMRARDEKYRAAREAAFTTVEGRRYLRELSIDEMPGITSRETTAVMLALCEAMGMPVNFVAPAFGFQKNMPYADQAELRRLTEAQWSVASRFGAGIGFHSGSGKSAENYRLLGEVTGSRLEIKTSGRYTYEMGVALAGSADPSDHQLWLDWHRFTAELAVSCAFSADETERRMARSFIDQTLQSAGRPGGAFASREDCLSAVLALGPSPEHVFFFEYNFLFVLAAGGRPSKESLGDHSAAGYAQRARFYAISDEARLLYAKGVASYIIFLAECTGLAPPERCGAARSLLGRAPSYGELLGQISR
jgi:hypothetical protein